MEAIIEALRSGHLRHIGSKVEKLDAEQAAALADEVCCRLEWVRDRRLAGP